MRAIPVLVATSLMLAACGTQPLEIGQADRVGLAIVGPDPEVKVFGSVDSEVFRTYDRNFLYGLLYTPMTLGASIFMSPAFGHSDAKDVRACLEPYFARRPDLVRELAAAVRRERPQEQELLDEFARVWESDVPGSGRLVRIAGGANRDAVLRDAATQRIDKLFEIHLTSVAVQYDYPCAIVPRVELELRFIRIADRAELLRKSLWSEGTGVDGTDGMETWLNVPGALKQKYLSRVAQASRDFFRHCDPVGPCGPPYPLHVAKTPER
jgi:hypothetical protein